MENSSPRSLWIRNPEYIISCSRNWIFNKKKNKKKKATNGQVMVGYEFWIQLSICQENWNRIEDLLWRNRCSSTFISEMSWLLYLCTKEAYGVPELVEGKINLTLAISDIYPSSPKFLPQLDTLEENPWSWIWG